MVLDATEKGNILLYNAMKLLAFIKSNFLFSTKMYKSKL